MGEPFGVLVPQEVVAEAVQLLVDHARVVRDCHTDSRGSWRTEGAAKEYHDRLQAVAKDLSAAICKLAHKKKSA